MRQAGRYLKSYREIRARNGILEICKRPELAAEVTLQPIEILNVDAAIIFADLLLPIEPMGLKLEFISGEGPWIENAITEPEDIDDLSTARTDDLGYVSEAIRKVTASLGDKVPVIGFVGAPFTLASYMIEGGPSKTFLKTKKLMFGNETMWRRLMGKLVDVLGDFARMQIGPEPALCRFSTVGLGHSVRKTTYVTFSPIPGLSLSGCAQPEFLSFTLAPARAVSFAKCMRPAAMY